MSLSVLVIEDENVVALDIKRIITNLGHTVCKIANTGLDAIEIAQTTKPDLLLSDINIKGEMSGTECCKILQHKYNIPVIFITAYHDTQTLQEASQVDFVGYLLKPFRENELETMINLAILKYQLFSKKEKQMINEAYSYCHESRVLFYHNKAIELTQKEDEFLYLLIKANGSIVSYTIMEHTIWHGEYVKDSTRRQLIYRFKQKVPGFPLELIKNQGYRLIIKNIT